MTYKDLTNRRYGRLTVNYLYDREQDLWNCKCDCGNYINVTAKKLKRGCCVSCGCKIPKRGVMAGQRYGKLTVIRPTTDRYRGSVVWECQCDCGSTTVVSAVFLKNGIRNSCGCMHSNRKVLKDGVLYSVDTISQMSGITPSVVYYHLAKGRTIDELLSHKIKGFKLDKNGNLVDVKALMKETGLARTTIYYRLSKGLVGDELKRPRGAKSRREK